MKRAMKSVRQNAISAVLLVIGVAMFFPLVWILLVSIRPASDLQTDPGSIIPSAVTLDSYFSVLTSEPILVYLLNSFIFATVSTLFTLVTSLIAGYLFAKFDFFMKRTLFILVIATAIVPFEVYLLPLFISVRDLGMVNTMTGLIFPFIVMSFGIFFVRQNVRVNVPDDLMGAARIDGMSEWSIMFRLVPPLVSPALSALAILAFTRAWTEFIWPLVVLNDPMLFPIEVGLSQYAGSFLADESMKAAASMICVLPTLIVFLVLRRRIIEGTSMTGMANS